MKYLISLLLVVLLTGCSSLSTVAKPNERVPLKLSEAPKLDLRKVEFVVIHKDNAEVIFKELEDKGLEPVVFALTGDDYKALASNIGDIKNHILVQRKIILLYKDYYEGK